jgi:adenine-specific DNA-methyltransferase
LGKQPPYNASTPASGYEGKISLIYIDPPFWTNENYYAKFEVGDKEITKIPLVIERLAYKDSWEGGIDSFLDMLYPRLQLKDYFQITMAAVNVY